MRHKTKRTRSVTVLGLALTGALLAGPGPDGPASARAASTSQGCPYENTTPLVVGEERARASMYCLISSERRRRGLRQLTVNHRLEAEAGAFASQMVDERFFSHVDPEGNGLLQRARKSGYLTGYGVWALGENIGWGSGTLGSPKAMMNALMNSAPHRRNILSRRYRNLGVGVSTGIPIGGRFGATYVQEFGWRAR